MRYAREPPKQWLSVRANRENLDTAVSKGVSQDHVGDENEQSYGMSGQKQQRQGQESCIHNGFTDIETV